jgi:hypothetical protein
MKRGVFALAMVWTFFFASSAHALLTDAICSQYYSPDGVKFNEFSSDRIEYPQGGNITLSYAIENRLGPIAEGAVFIILQYQGPEMANRLDDGDIVGEFFSQRDLSLQKNDQFKGSVVWNVPKNARPGVYVARSFFVVKDKLSAGGLYFYSSVPAESTSFKISGLDKGVFMLERNATTINGVPYRFRAPVPKVGAGEAVKIKTRLSDGTNGAVNVTYQLFSWSDLGEEYAQYGKQEIVTDTRELNYDLPGLGAGVYMFKITASSGDWKSIIRLRFYVQGESARFAWIGLDRFPLKAGEKANVSICLFNSASEPGDADTLFPAKMEVTLADGDGNVLLKEDYSTENLTALLRGKIAAFTSDRQYTKLKLKGIAYDGEGKKTDVVEIVYDYSKFPGVKRAFSMDAPDSASGNIVYNIIYEDEYGGKLPGDAIVYLSDPSGEVVKTKESSFVGQLSDRMDVSGLPAGRYALKAVEKGQTLSSEKIVALSDSVSSTTQASKTTTSTETETSPAEEDPQKSMGSYWPVVVALLCVALLAIYLLNKKGGKK